MKYVSTKRNILCRYGKENCIEVPYCALQSLLRYEEPEAYTSGTYGWNADVYGFAGIAIVTGYRPFGGCRPDYDLFRKYEKLADDLNRKIIEAGECWMAGQHEMRKLIEAFIAEAFGV